ncbi:DUF3224 domain-containing protein [Amycolatopsis sp. NPDC059021]|uniref:DUF3224 domain-containing protein n=1 Tax=Amycolatopsis sp. NPDC059021 TaxID=3346704 RepID=UPI00366B38C1
MNTFTMNNWEERIVSGSEGEPRVAYAHASMTFSGVIEGEASCDYLLFYPGEGYDGGGTTSPGYDRIEGSVDGRKGTFVLRHEFTFDLDGLSSTFSVVPGSGTGELAGLSGSGTIKGTPGVLTVAYTFEYTVD